jgi:hypothetical protein
MLRPITPELLRRLLSLRVNLAQHGVVAIPLSAPDPLFLEFVGQAVHVELHRADGILEGLLGRGPAGLEGSTTAKLPIGDI